MTIKDFCREMELTKLEAAFIKEYINDGTVPIEYDTDCTLQELIEALDALKASDVYGSDYDDEFPRSNLYKESKKKRI